MIRESKFRNKRIIFTILSLFCIYFIFIQSVLPADESSQESGRILEILNKLTDFLGLSTVFSHNFVRKCAHFTEFALLSTCLFCMYRTYARKLSYVSIMTSASYLSVAIVDECIQLFSPGRACQVIDVLIDFFGGTIALILLLFMCFLKNRGKSKQG